MDLPIVGYEIHMGHTDGNGTSAPFLLEERSRKPYNGTDESLGVDGNVLGTYVHGLFHNDGLRRSILEEIARRKGAILPRKSNVVSREQEYDKLATLVRNHLDMELIYRLLGLG